MSAQLQLSGVVGGYGPVRILHGIDLTAAAGSVTALIGSNGAGKSTTLRTIAGLLPVVAGSISFDGRPIAALSTDQRVDLGIVMVPEGRLIFSDMTVEENLRIGAFTARARGNTAENLAKIYELFPRFLNRKAQAGGTLSGGEQQMLALGRGLMAEPKVLLLDEPSLGLAPVVARQIFEIIEELRRTGLTILIAEQDVHRTLQIADHAFVLESGEIALDGPSDRLRNEPGIQEAYLGL
ncbi:MAG: ABC transporter ATP-binding protein [Rhodospirillales bacterium]|jgi:branched-chain amino acid transport system ATP-binding protein|nr:branched-chain amino acid ABC transporter ATP-binding protein [Rhodospirillaceae bacterium]MDP6427767.1 ABC transporter ATP-binding protein [Rhodospirillales bacterium]MDP6644600.1 ABC transporter ATP-binding protein [Rhodospirillales bacterium]MDP6843781.1 ABC transporter ATP-binding protein [Rhodospirillales bacterium]|tara:strand:+ start:278 stop:991 length:714 start_codon:yes stop_codon:yes gene_type:complete